MEKTGKIKIDAGFFLSDKKSIVVRIKLQIFEFSSGTSVPGDDDSFSPLHHLFQVTTIQPSPLHHLFQVVHSPLHHLFQVTTIQPGDCKTELSGLTTDEEARQQCAQENPSPEYWLAPEDVARAVVFAATAPPNVGVNEVLVEPRAAPA